MGTGDAGDDLRRGDAQEGDAALVGDGVRERRLAAAGRAVQQHPPRRVGAHPVVHLHPCGGKRRS